MPTSRTDICLGVFAKCWTPGEVKTRLAASIGAQKAAALHRQFVAATLTRLEAIDAERVIAYWPPESESEFKKLAPTWQRFAQTPGDLGDRLRAFFAAQFASGYQRVLIVGSDSPNLPINYVDQAFETLDDFSIVLGPSDDGGYYLIGAKSTPVAALAEIPWGSNKVWKTTIDRLNAAGIPFGTIPVWYDVDRREDLTRLHNDLQNDPTRDPALKHLEAEITRLVD